MIFFLLFLPVFSFAVTFTDDFNDGDISDWETRCASGTWSSSGGTVNGSTGSTPAVLAPLSPLSYTDCTVAVSATGVHAFGMIARLTEGDSGIIAYVSPDNNVARIRQVVNGQMGSTLNSLSASFPSGVYYDLTFTCAGNLLTFLIEVPSTGDSWQFSASDPNPQAGTIGLLMGQEPSAHWDWIEASGFSEGNAYMSWFSTYDAAPGNGNMCLEPGETIALAIELTNPSDEPLYNTFGILQALNSDLVVINNYVSYGTLAGPGSSYGSGTFSVMAPLITPEDETYDMRLTVMADGGYQEQMEFCLPVGCGTSNDVENGASGWSWGAVTSGWASNWHVSSARNHTSGGDQSFKCGSTGSGDYSDHHFGYLDSPYINLPLSGEFSFWSWLDAQQLTYMIALDGGIVQCRRLGEWIDMFPVPSYTHIIASGSTGPFPDGTALYSGIAGWTEYTIQIPDSLAGPGAFRFVFGSDDQGSREGWYIDDLTVTSNVSIEESSAGVYPQSFLSVLENPFTESVTFRYFLPGGGESAITIYDVSGRRVNSLPAGAGASIESLLWNGSDSRGIPVPAGVYFAAIEGTELTPLRLIKL